MMLGMRVPALPPSAVSVKPERSSLWPQRLAALGAVLFIYVAACCTPSYYIVTSQGEHVTWWGFGVLLTGWTGVFVGQFAWFSNFFLLFGAIGILCRLWITSAVMALLAVALAMDTFTLFGKVLPADEGDVNHMQVVALGFGFYIWLASMAALLLAALWLKMADAKARRIALYAQFDSPP